MKLVAIGGFLALLFFHLFRLSGYPGLHYDEAWAANFSLRILTEPNFWPREAMSPYTSAWSHYVAAFFFKVFGVNLAIYRISQIFLTFSGLGFMYLALRRRYGFAAYYLPVAILALPGLYLNHRFGIELNSLHVFAFGWLLYALANRHAGQAVCATLLGVTSHLLFFGVAIAVLGFLFVRRIELSIRERVWIVVGSLSLLPFFALIFQKIPETKKAAALLIADIIVLIVFGTPLWKKMQNFSAQISLPKWRWQFFLFFAPLIFPLFLFAEGHWTVFLYKGAWQSWPLFGLGLLLLSPALYWGVRAVERRGDLPFMLLLLVCVAAIVPKATPRYFEIPLLCLAACVGVGWAVMPQQTLRRVTLCLALICSTLLFSHQLLPGETREGKIHLLYLVDESTDFLAKQRVAAELGLRGCAISDIRIADFRGGEALRFLQHGDWPLANTPCPWPQAIWRRATQVQHAPEFLLGVAGTVLER